MQEYTNHSDTTFALRNISFRVPGRTLLHPLSLTFPAGKVTGLIGHNGSGKSRATTKNPCVSRFILDIEKIILCDEDP